MLELTTTGRLVEYEPLEDRSELAAVLARTDLEAAAASGQPAQLWLELAQDKDDETARLSVELTTAQLSDILERSGGSDVAFLFDDEALASLLEEPDVEAHGLRGALAVAVTSAAVLAPTSMAAVPQSVETSAAAQRVSSAVTSQVEPSARSQVRPAALETQRAKSQVVKSQVSKRFVLKGHGLQLLRSGLTR
jgi:hypothetical protein